jgi:hypothetical protein
MLMFLHDNALVSLHNFSRNGNISKISGIAYLQEIPHMLYFFLWEFPKAAWNQEKHSDEVKNKGKTK